MCQIAQTLCLCSGARFETIFHNFWEYAKIAQTLCLCSGARQEHVQKDQIGIPSCDETRPQTLCLCSGARQAHVQKDQTVHSKCQAEGFTRHIGDNCIGSPPLRQRLGDRNHEEGEEMQE